MNIIPFSEVQRFRQVWLWILLPTVFAITALSTILSIKSGGFWDIIFSVGVPLVIMLLFLRLALHTRIDETGVYYHFTYFHFKERHIPWSDIQKAYVRKYKPLAEYGGWGIRYSFGNGKAFNVSGNMGLQLELKNGKKILIGTQKAGEIEALLKGMPVNSLTTKS